MVASIRISAALLKRDAEVVMTPNHKVAKRGGALGMKRNPVSNIIPLVDCTGNRFGCRPDGGPLFSRFCCKSRFARVIKILRVSCFREKFVALQLSTFATALIGFRGRAEYRLQYQWRCRTAGTAPDALRTAAAARSDQPSSGSRVARRSPARSRLRGAWLTVGMLRFGARLHPLARTLTGIDISSNMLKIAQQRQIYDNLVCGELSEFLQTQTKKFDLVGAADVFVYRRPVGGVSRSSGRAEGGRLFWLLG
jgi:hypothetical protein